MKGRVRFGKTGQDSLLDGGNGIQLFGVDNCRKFIQQHCAAGVARAAAARHDGQAERDTGAHQRCDFGFRVGMQHHERVFHAPVGRVGDVRDTRQPVELDVVAARNARQFL